MSVALSTMERELAEAGFEALRRGEKPAELIASEVDVEAAYRIQLAIVGLQEASGRALGGWKAGFVPPALAATFGDGALVSGPLYRDGIRESPADLAADLPGLVVEVEVGLLLGEPLCGPGMDVARARAAVAGIAPCFEIMGGPQSGLIGESVSAYLAAGAGNWGVVTGPTQAPTPGLDSTRLGAELTIDGEPMPGTAMLENPACPFETLAALANELARFERRIDAGQWVITGARAVRAQCPPGAYEGRIEQIGSVRMRVE